MANHYGKKKILQVLPALQEGGVERGVYDLCNFARGSGFEYEIMVASSGGKFADLLEESGTKHFQFDLKTKNPIKIILNAFRLANICRENNIGIIHARSRAPAWSAHIAAKILKITFITTFHGFYRRGGFLKNFYNSVMAKGDKIIAVSNFVKKHILENYKTDSDKIIIIHRGVDLEFFNPEKISDADAQSLKAKYNIQGKKIILLVGRITRWKAQDVAINALNYLKNQNAVLLIIGSAEKKNENYFNELQDLKNKLVNPERVIFAGSSDNLPLFYSASDIVLNCSREAETFGRVTAEAGAFGKPIIATNIGGSLEIIVENETGYFVNPDDPKQLAEKIDEVLKLFENKVFAEEFSVKVKKRIFESFSLEQMCNRNFELYTKEITRKIP